MDFHDPGKELTVLMDALSLSFVPLLDANTDDERFASLSESDRINAYAALSQIYYARYQLNDVADDFNRCITMYKKAVALMTDGDDRRRVLLVELSKAFLLHSECTESLDHLHSADKYAAEAWNLTTDDPKAMAELLDYIGRRVFWQYYALTRDIGRLNDAISNIETALDLDEQLTYWDDYSTLLLQRFSKTRSVPDLNDAIKWSERCVSSKELDSWKQALFRLHLGKGLLYRHQLTGSIPDINRAVDVSREALQLLQPFNLFDAIKSRGEQAYREFDRLAQYVLLLFMALDHRFRCIRSREEDADEAIKLGEAALKAASKFPTARASIMSSFELLTQLLRMNLGGTSSVRSSLFDPMSRQRPVKDLDPMSEPLGNERRSPVVRGEQLLVLASQSFISWEGSGDSRHLDEGILRYEQALQLIPDYHSVDPYIVLVRSLNIRFHKSSSPKDHEQAVEYAEKALSLVSKADPTYSTCLFLLGATLRQSPEFKKVARAIDLLEQALEIIPEESPDRQECVFNLSVALSVQFKRSGDQRYADQQIDLERAAIPMLLKQEAPETVRHLCALSYALLCRYRLDGSRENIDEAIRSINKAIELPAHHIFNRTVLDDRLGWCYFNSYDITGSMDDLRQAIDIFAMTESVTPSITPSAHVTRSSRQIHLIHALRELFFNTGALEDLEVALNYCKDCISKGPDSGSSQRHVLEMALSLLSHRATFEGSTYDLDYLSKIDQRKSSLTPADSYTEMFRSVFELLDRVATRIQEKLGLQHSSDLKLSSQLTNWNLRKESDESEADIIQTLERVEPAVQGIQKSLVRSLLTFWKQLVHAMEMTESSGSGQVKSSFLLQVLDRAIEVCKQALEASGKGLFHPHYMSSLVTMLSIRFTSTKSLDHLSELIEWKENLLEIRRLGHKQHGTVLRTLSNDLLARFRLTGSSEDLDRSIQLKEKAARTVALPPRQRFVLAVTAAELCFKMEPQDLKRAQHLIGQAVKIMPMVTLRHLSQRDLHGNISMFGNVISKAVSLALDSGEDPAQCLQLLESERGVISGTHIDLRFGGSQLAELPDEIAREFVKLQQNLDSPFSDCQSLDLPTSDVEVLVSPSRFFSAMENRRKNAVDFSDHLKTIRSLQGFESFLIGPSESEMKSLAAEGPIVIFTVSEIRSDAFIVTPLKIWSVPLPQLTYTEALDHTEKLLKAVDNASMLNLRTTHETVRRILEWLWDVAVSRVLDELGFTKTPQDDQVWPHVWWVCCGVLSFFPVHMAGYHHRGSDRSALDRVISSYASALRSLSYARSCISSRTPEATQRILLVGMPDTPNKSKLPNIAEEMKELKNLLNPVEPPLRNPDKKTFLEALGNASVLHLACHGKLDPVDPSRSQFLLSDWETNPLTVANLASKRTGSHLQFANLSTCHNAVSRNFNLLDEAIHLSSAAQLAGFPSVVGTLWQVYDSVAAEVSKELYINMLENGRLNTGKGAEALHRAACTSVDLADM